jgi:hypothetical protein
MWVQNVNGSSYKRFTRSKIRCCSPCIACSIVALKLRSLTHTHYTRALRNHRLRPLNLKCPPQLPLRADIILYNDVH